MSGENSPQAEIENPSHENDDIEQLSEEEELQSKMLMTSVHVFLLL